LPGGLSWLRIDGASAREATAGFFDSAARRSGWQRVGIGRPIYYAQVNLDPQAVKLVLDNGHPVVVEVAGESMSPTLARGTKVTIEPVAEDVHAGDIVLIATSDQDELVLHRVMHVFGEAGRRYVIHQGDAPGSDFATCPREAVVGRAAGIELPAPRVLDPVALARYKRRRRVAVLYSLGRRAKFRLRLNDFALGRRGVFRLSRIYRALARKMVR